MRSRERAGSSASRSSPATPPATTGARGRWSAATCMASACRRVRHLRDGASGRPRGRDQGGGDRGDRVVRGDVSATACRRRGSRRREGRPDALFEEMTVVPEARVASDFAPGAGRPRDARRHGGRRHRGTVGGRGRVGGRAAHRSRLHPGPARGAPRVRLRRDRPLSRSRRERSSPRSRATARMPSSPRWGRLGSRGRCGRGDRRRLRSRPRHVRGERPLQHPGLDPFLGAFAGWAGEEASAARSG